MSDKPAFPPYVDYLGKRLLLLEVLPQPEIAGTPTRLGYGYAAQGYHADRIVYYRWDFGNGVDWELTWVNTETKSYTDFSAEMLSWDAKSINPNKEMSLDDLEQALVKMFPEQMELRPTDKLKHEVPKRPRAEPKPKKRLQETPPEAKGEAERPRINLSDFIRPFQGSMTRGDKKK